MADDDALALPSNLQLLLAKIVTLALDFGIRISVRNITDDLNQKGFKSISKSDFDFDLNHLEINDLKPRFTAV